MSRVAVGLFEWVQRAPFYVDVHRAAVGHLPPGSGATWLDVGCGPGLVARLAAAHGYRATGVDVDPGMVAAARRHDPEARADYVLGGLDELPEADVVSAASLLAVVPDVPAAVRQLWEAVRPGGALLVIETTSDMTPAVVRAALRRRHVEGRAVLRRWAGTRRGRAVDHRHLLELPESSVEHHLLLEGLVAAWILWKSSMS
jgi:ubiquinone/menaquinone biosynthesis C-methylase UbiE